jgi:hypothetical protein
MTPLAITFLIVSLVLVWGGLIASAIALSIRPELRVYPPGGGEDDRVGHGPIEHDT